MFWPLVMGIAACHSSQQTRERDRATERTIPPKTGDASSGDDLELPTVIRGLLQIPANRQVRVPGGVVIEAGGRLELGAGDRVAVAPGKSLRVWGGELVAKGTPEAPILFTSLSATPRAGDWCGIVVDWAELPARSDKSTWPTTSLDHAIIEFAGRPWDGRYEDERVAGGLSIKGYLERQDHESAAGRVVLSNVEIRDNALRGVDIRTNGSLSVNNLKFGHNGGVSARLNIEYAPELGSAPTEAVELVGDVRKSTELPVIPTEYVVLDNILVGSWSIVGAPAVLTIRPGTTLKFNKAKHISVGHLFVGRLVAHGATFTSAEWQPAPGDWRGIHVGELGSMELDGDTFEYADEYAVGWYIVTRSRIQLQRSTFRHIRGAAIFDPVSCAKWQKAELGIVSDKKPLCTRDWRKQK
jgi:hypothetical protein